MRKTRGEAGFTLIEVVMALMVFTVAMLGLVALQRASVSGANSGREQTAAVNLARWVMTWVENEASAWPVAVTDPAPAANDLPLLAQGLTGPDAWHTLSESADVRWDAYLEHSDEDLYADVDSAQYCVHYKLSPLGDTAAPVAYQVWVRVTWPKWKQYETAGDTPWNDCAARISDDPTVVGRFDVVELTGIVTREFTGRWS